MQRIIVVVDAEVDRQGQLVNPAAELGQRVSALQAAIAAHPIGTGPCMPQLISARALDRGLLQVKAMESWDDEASSIICPLTLEVPAAFQFSGQEIYRVCRDVMGLRQWVERQVGIRTGNGVFWLPIALTAKGPLYAEGIGSLTDSGVVQYVQPLHLPDSWRQRLYSLGWQVLRSLSAPPSVYLLQWGHHDGALIFDRLFPFPAVPALASLGVQIPDLFVCHWRCLTQQPLLDLAIVSPPVNQGWHPLAIGPY